VEVFGASGIEHWPLLRLHLCLLLRLHLHLLLRLLLRLNPSPATPVAAPTKPCAPRRGLLLLLFRLPGCRAGCSACCSAGCPFHLARPSCRGIFALGGLPRQPTHEAHRTNGKGAAKHA
jgi:hypothetical protein